MFVSLIKLLKLNNYVFDCKTFRKWNGTQNG